MNGLIIFHFAEAIRLIDVVKTQEVVRDLRLDPSVEATKMSKSCAFRHLKCLQKLRKSDKSSSFPSTRLCAFHKFSTFVVDSHWRTVIF